MLFRSRLVWPSIAKKVGRRFSTAAGESSSSVGTLLAAVGTTVRYTRIRRSGH